MLHRGIAVRRATANTRGCHQQDHADCLSLCVTSTNVDIGARCVASFLFLSARLRAWPQRVRMLLPASRHTLFDELGVATSRARWQSS
jgi:hypothetical protein